MERGIKAERIMVGFLIRDSGPEFNESSANVCFVLVFRFERNDPNVI